MHTPKLTRNSHFFVPHRHMGHKSYLKVGTGRVIRKAMLYTRKNAQVATDLQTSCNKSVHKLLTRCIRTACSEFVRTSLEQAVDKL